MKHRGKAWVFGDDISTDLIAPGRYFHLRSNLKELATYVLEDARDDFASNVGPGDFVVGGENFGLGSSREHAPTIIKLSGISVVLAKSFARIFFRNSVNIGLPVVMVDTSSIEDGDVLEVDLAEGTVFNSQKDEKLHFTPMSKALLRIIEDGGLVEHIKKHKDIVL